MRVFIVNVESVTPSKFSTSAPVNIPDQVVDGPVHTLYFRQLSLMSQGGNSTWVIFVSTKGISKADP